MSEKEEGSNSGETMAGNLKEKPADAESFDGQKYAGGGGQDEGTGGGYAGGTNVSSQGGGTGSTKQGGNTGDRTDASG